MNIEDELRRQREEAARRQRESQLEEQRKADMRRAVFQDLYDTVDPEGLLEEIGEKYLPNDNIDVRVVSKPSDDGWWVGLYSPKLQHYIPEHSETQERYDIGGTYIGSGTWTVPSHFETDREERGFLLVSTGGKDFGQENRFWINVISFGFLNSPGDSVEYIHGYTSLADVRNSVVSSLARIINDINL